MLHDLHKALLSEQEKAIQNFQLKLKQEDDVYYASKKWQKKGYLFNSYKTRKILTVYGELSIRRRYYYSTNKKKGYFYIDKKYSLEAYKRLGEDIKETIYHQFGKVSVLNIAKALGICRQTVYNALTDLGKKKIVYTITPDYNVTKIYIQADEDHLKMQKSIPLSNQARLIMFYTDRKKVSKNRYELVDKGYFIFTRQENFTKKWEEVLEYITLKYPNCKQYYIGSDGGKWIQKSREVFSKKQTIHIYDHFHFKQSLTRIFGSSKMGDDLKYIAREYVKNDLKNDFIKLAKSWFKYVKKENLGKITSRKNEFKKCLNFWKEIRQNWLLTDYHGTSAEGHISHYLSSKLSSRPKAFSMKRLKHYLKLIEYQLNNVSYKTYKEADTRRGIKTFCVLDERVEAYNVYNNSSSNVAVLNHATNTSLRKYFQSLLSV